jgi:hypothetical protein
MALQKTPLQINFAQGLDLKSDEKQIPFGKFLRLKNSVFQKIGLLQKRNGFKKLASLPDASSTYTTTFNGNLTAIGTSLQAYSEPSQTWVNKGALQPVQLSTLAVRRSDNNALQCDAAVAPNGLLCSVFTETDSVTSTTRYYYVVEDSSTGQIVVNPLALTNASGAPRVFVLGNFFVIVFTATITATAHLQYLAINYNSLNVGTITDISTTYTPASTVAFDGVVANNNLYLAWNGSDVGHSVRATRIDSTLLQHGTVTFAATGVVAIYFSLTADTTGSTPIVYVNYASSTDLYTLVVDQSLNTVLSPTHIDTVSVKNIASSAQDGSETLFVEVNNNYTYDTTIPTHYVDPYFVTEAGVISGPDVRIRSVGLASKSFIIDETIYFLATYSSDYQPTYFLMDSEGNAIAKLAYSNGGGYLTLGLPGVTVDGSTASIAYLIRDLIEPVNKDMGASNAGLGIYAEKGVNVATFTVSTSNIVSAEIGQDLNLSGGFIWMYDGQTPVEQGFHLYPDNVEVKGQQTGALETGSITPQAYFYQAIYEWTDNKGNIFRSAPSLPVSFTVTTPPATFTGNRTSGSKIISAISSTANLQAGQAVSGTGIPANTYIQSVDSTTQVTLSIAATSGTATSTVITPTVVNSLHVYVPTLRVTYKYLSSITIYRWSTAQPVFYKVTSVSNFYSPELLVGDYIDFRDTLADSSIIGNEILYTTGGVVENVAAPASTTMTLYKSRLITLDAEDRNLLWYSKQVIESTPVEMSDLFTIYVAPTQSVEGSSGPITALSALDDKLIIFKKDAIYYITGNGPDNTGANNDFSDPVFITSTVGCDNQQSIVFTPNGIMFQSDKGIWLLGRDLSTIYIGAAVEDFNSYEVLSAENIPGTNQVRFALSNGTTLVYNYFFGQWGTFEGVASVSSTIFQGLHTFINSYGDAYQENPGSFLDGTNPVLMGFTTGWLNVAGLQGFQRVYWMNFIGKYISPHQLVLRIGYDYNSSPTQLTPVSPDNYAAPYGDDPLYGSTYVYGGSTPLEQWEVFFQRQKCQSIQISIDEIFDPSFDTVAGEGLTLSGINLMYGIKGNYPRLPAANSVG